MTIRVGLDISATSFNNAGTARYSLELLNALQQLNLDDIELVELNVARKFRITKPGLLRKLFVLYWESVYCNLILPLLIRHHKLDVLHCTSPIPIRRGLIPTTVGIVTTIFDVIPFSHPEWFSRIMKTRLRKWILRCISASHHLIAISQFTRGELCSRLNVPVEQVTVTYLGNTEPLFIADPEPQPTILAVGTLEPRKNLATVVEAYSLLKHEIDPWPSLTIVGGEGWGDVALLEIIRRLNVENDVHLLGFVPDARLFALYKQASVFIYTSLQEGFGLPILEAMARGCPVIASNTSSLPEVIGDAGILVEPRDAHQLAGAMKRVLTDIGLASHMREKGLERAARFSWRKCAEQTIDVYRNTFAELANPSPWRRSS